MKAPRRKNSLFERNAWPVNVAIYLRRLRFRLFKHSEATPLVLDVGEILDALKMDIPFERLFIREPGE
jgi:hypothetical protein